MSLMFAGQLLAIEPPDHPVAPPPAPTPLPSPAAPASPTPQLRVSPAPMQENPELHPRQRELLPGPNAASTVRPYLGVGTMPVPKLLAVHLGLAEGNGVIVRTLDPQGPAAKSGLAEYDVIKSINGKSIASHADLCDVLCKHQPGDEVSLDAVHEGKSALLKVKLGERKQADLAMAHPQPLDNLLDGMQGEQADRIRKAIEQNLRGMERDLGAQAEQIAPQVDQAMRDMQKRAERMLGEAERQGHGMLNMSSESTIRLLDGQGSIELKAKDGGKEVIVRDPSGKERWSGPWDNEQDKAAAPADIRERVDKLKIDMTGKGNSLRLQLGAPRGGIQDGVNGVDD